MFKIDLRAYDTVEWCFVENLLEELHFPSDFKAMILQCITTTTFSLSINGEMLGYFQGKRGLRQGDPLSPLIFTLCMEYLTRSLQYASSNPDFHYHPMCKKQRLASLMFADDVMLFSKGDATSMMLLLQSFSTFSNASGLQVSASKSNAYFRNVPEQLKSEILRYRFMKGASHLNTLVCQSRLQDSGSKIVSVLWIKFVRGYMGMGQENSLMQEGIIKRIEAVCRNFLWDNSNRHRRAPLVGWDTICRPKDEGGLGIKDQESWNKGQEWMEYKPSSNSSWVWRRICKVKEEMRNGYVNGEWSVQPEGTRFLVAMTAREEQGQEFNGIRQFGMGGQFPSINSWDGCFKTIEHLFCECPYSRRVVLELNRTRLTFPVGTWLNGAVLQTSTGLRKGVQNAIVMSLMYQVWQQRNRSRNEMTLLRPERVAGAILENMRSRVRTREKTVMTLAERDWLIKMRLLE
ncbi:uncharacterized protein LOC141630406 [Silene latifolia]|uniref:uncharacterized protein LOC141630406 n=1 Tax=Silene latifolia TaxID=37657 RepID=UPI003D77CC15